MKEYLSKWTIPRLLQLAVGLYFLRDYYLDGGRMVLVFGGVMMAQAVLNVGCFSSRGCSTSVTPVGKDAESITNEIEVEYEEL